MPESSFKIYSSSAGSGKTYNLVKEYIKLVLKNPSSYRNILAVTFTNKAAEEMKRRIIEKLKQLINSGDNKYENELKKEGVEGDIAGKSRLVLNYILHNYSYFSVCTIDSFFNRIIRSFARELKLQLGYNIEIQSDEAMQKVVDDLLNETGTNKSLTNYLEHYVINNIADNKEWKIEKNISGLSKQILNEKYWELKLTGKNIIDDRDKILNIVSKMNDIIKTFESKMSETGEKAEALLKDTGTSIEDFYYAHSGPAAYLVKLKYKREYEPNSYVPAFLNGKSIYSGGCKNKEAVKKAYDSGLRLLLEEAVHYVNLNYRKYCTALEIKKTIFINGILNDLIDNLKKYRDEHNVILIEDLSFIIRSIVKDNPAPFIFEKSAYTYKHFLIDEFQDTSSFQWQNMLPLIVNSLSDNNYSMVVGDSKQSIYRFRGSNPTLLSSNIYRDLGAFKENIHTTALAENRRSKDVLVKFYNNLFEDLPDQLMEGMSHIPPELIAEIKNVYSNVQQTPMAGTGGYVKIKFLDRDIENYVEHSDILTEQYILDAIEDGYKLSDIMILTRKREEGSKLACFLMKAGHNVLSEESLLLTSSPGVNLIINLLKIIVDSKNNLARVEALYDYLIYLKKDGYDLSELFTDHIENKLFSSVIPRDFFAETGKDFTIKNKIETLNLYQLIEYLIDLFELDALDSYMLRLKDVVLEFMRNQTSDINSFLLWWVNHNDEISIVVPEEQNAIRIMTIHKAKGLQNKIVIIPYLNWSLNQSGKDLLWVETDQKPFDESAYLVRATKRMEKTYFEDRFNTEVVSSNIDNLNLIYVAFTRASDRLYVTGSFYSGYIKVIPGMLDSMFKNSPEWMQHYNTRDLVYEVGVREKNISAGKSTPKEVLKIENDTHAKSSAYGKMVYKQKHENIDASQYTRVIQRKEYGVLVHKVLSSMKKLEDLKPVVDDLVSGGYLQKDTALNLKKELDEIFKIEQVKDWFSGEWEVHSEKDLLLPDGTLLRPDRVIAKGKEALVIDFKTGVNMEQYKPQMDKYEQALKNMGYTDIQKLILSIKERKVLKVG